MKVYCRFAPPQAPATMEGERDEADLQAAWLPPPMVLLSVRETCGDQKQQNKHYQTVTVADPRSGSMASATCRRIFLPQFMGVGAGSTPPAATQRQQQEVFDEVVRPFIEELLSGKRCTFLAYGQTATGKTYTMFGPNNEVDSPSVQRRQQSASSSRNEATERQQQEEEEEGIVPRLLRAIFDEPGPVVQEKVVDFVDLS
ncbi:putative kinesin, partial [Trypanosoma grayi]|uniref:putative kinesin n=1 Tax=Trypanosoma grayi TaxID=71804 RepID=UPI0004F48C04